MAEQDPVQAKTMAPRQMQQKICRMVPQLLQGMSELFCKQDPPQYVLYHCMTEIFIKKILFSHPTLQIPQDWFQKKHFSFPVLSTAREGRRHSVLALFHTCYSLTWQQPKVLPWNNQHPCINQRWNSFLKRGSHRLFSSHEHGFEVPQSR